METADKELGASCAERPHSAVSSTRSKVRGQVSQSAQISQSAQASQSAQVLGVSHMGAIHLKIYEMSIRLLIM